MEFELDAALIPKRLAEVQASCTAQTFGDCAVLGAQSIGGEHPYGALTVRIAPAGVEPLLTLAGQGGEVTGRTATAEDLAQAVQDNAVRRTRLEKEHARLSAFAARKDLELSDMLTLSTQLAQIEEQLEAAQRNAAQHKRRIDTNLLAMRWQPPGADAARSEIALALESSGERFAGGTALVINATAYLAPLVFALGIPIVGIRWWRGRAKRAA